MNTLHHSRISTPIGELLLVANDKGLTYVAFADENHTVYTAQSKAEEDSILRQAKEELGEYFAGERTEFSVPLSWPLDRDLGFRNKVQRFLSTIPYGGCMTYKEVATLVGNPGAVRAVGSACATNPLPIFTPCHRVLRTDGAIGGYRGGPEAKQWLIELESESFRT